jgi:ubiquinone/menaquinone biosynthesis C-methylase UbiE
LPFTDGEFGAVFCSHVLEHMADVETIQSAWSELHRVADTVVVCVPVKQLIVHWLVPDHYLWASCALASRVEMSLQAPWEGFKHPGLPSILIPSSSSGRWVVPKLRYA